ncbi:MAG: hypothetical protein Q8K02_13015, partial [Flavobacterium sp.]|nr:hypothetical protein [Flavobacterium sp.]
MKSILYILFGFLLFSNSVRSQQKIASFTADHNKEQNLFSVADNTGATTLFLADKTKLTGIQFDESFRIKDSLSIAFNPKELKRMVATHPNE